MTTPKKQKASQRRDFLKLAGLGAVAGSVMAASGAPKEAAAREADSGASGYRETDHVKQVYTLSRF